MANHNGRTERDHARNFANQNLQNFQAGSDTIEHGYQDPRDQRDRQPGRDDFRGGDFAERNFQSTDRNREDRWSPRGVRGLSQAGDEFAETERNMYGDRDRFGRADAEATDYHRGSGYGYDDGNPRHQMNYRGQSGAQAGGRPENQSYRGPATRGGNEGHWGDFDRGGQSARVYGGSHSYDTQAPQYGAQDPRSANVGRGPHAGKGPKGFVRSDERILELVHEILTDHEHVDASNITVDVKNGEVTLTGNVDQRSAKLQAEDLVATVSGVKDVHNQIRVGTSSTTSQVESDSGKTKLRS